MSCAHGPIAVRYWLEILLVICYRVAVSEFTLLVPDLKLYTRNRITIHVKESQFGFDLWKKAIPPYRRTEPPYDNNQAKYRYAQGKG